MSTAQEIHATRQTIREIDAHALKRLLDADQAILIDVREESEFAREHILGARLVPLSGFDEGNFPRDHDKTVVFHCASGMRTATNAQRILRTGFRDIRHLEGGIKGWKAAGFPVYVNRKAPIDILRQVQIAAGALTLAGVGLAAIVSPWFMAINAAVGIGIFQAGISGSCLMASLLKFAPWNRGAFARA